MTERTAIPAAGEAVPSDQKVADAMRDLEDDIIDLAHMSDIAWDQFTGIFERPDKTSGLPGMEVFTFTITSRQREVVAFAINNVNLRATSLRTRYAAAYEGKVRK